MVSGATRDRWQLYLAVLAVACLPLGLIWDISWHVSIGRDTFWAPAHIMIQFGGVIPASLFALRAFRTTFWGAPEDRIAAPSFWGARAPFGAWVTMWGALAMLTSAPFDDWWHNTYGLDVKIVSPPHAVLGLGMFAVALGVLLFVLSFQNRSTFAERRIPAAFFLLAAGLLVTLIAVYSTEFTWPNQQHRSQFYGVMSLAFPFLLVMIATASPLSWAATRAAAFYMGLMMFMIWLLPLFPAQPKLAPIYHPVDHMVPPPFPLLIVLPAFALDWLIQRTRLKAASAIRGRSWRGFLRDWLQAAVLGIVFLAVTLAGQWFFAQFLLSPAADNWFFAGNRHWPYYVLPGEWRHQFWEVAKDPVTLKNLSLAAAIAAVSARVGMGCGRWMTRVQR